MNETVEMLNIAEFSKAEVLAALYNASHPLGLGFMQFDPKPMTTQEAQAIIDDILSQTWNNTQELYFDYLKGRVMKVDLTGDAFRPRLYDRDNGPGAAANVLGTLRKSKAA